MADVHPTTPPGDVPAAVVDEHPSVNLLIMATGSIAAIKLGLLLDQLSTEHCHIRIAATSSAFHFLHRAEPSNTGIPFQSILTDKEEWEAWQAMNDTVVHIELRKWADLVVIAPLDANSLAKISTGLCDNLVTCVMRAWEVQEKPVIICPAMNTAMWTHTITARQISSLRDWYMTAEAAEASEMAQKEHALTVGAENVEPMIPATLDEAMFQIVGPVMKTLACGDVGMGGMAPVESIATAIRHTMNLIREKKKTESMKKKREAAPETADA